MFSKLIKCKTCNAEIARSAKTCPRCGAENINIAGGCLGCLTGSTIIIIITVVILGAGFFFMISILKNLPPPDPDTIRDIEAADRNIEATCQVEFFLKGGYLKDPDSYQSISWGPVRTASKGLKYSYFIYHRYRAKNSFGGYAVASQIFYLSNDYTVIGLEDLE